MSDQAGLHSFRGVSKFTDTRSDKTLQAVAKEACDYAFADNGLEFSTFKGEGDETTIPTKFLVETDRCIHSFKQELGW